MARHIARNLLLGTAIAVTCAPNSPPSSPKSAVLVAPLPAMLSKAEYDQLISDVKTEIAKTREDMLNAANFVLGKNTITVSLTPPCDYEAADVTVDCNGTTLSLPHCAQLLHLMISDKTKVEGRDTPLSLDTVAADFPEILNNFPGQIETYKPKAAEIKEKLSQNPTDKFLYTGSWDIIPIHPTFAEKLLGPKNSLTVEVKDPRIINAEKFLAAAPKKKTALER
jgi:hypothetical protein